MTNEELNMWQQRAAEGTQTFYPDTLPSPTQTKTDTLLANTAKKVDNLAGKTDVLLGMEDADTFRTKNYESIREGLPLIGQ